jgi:hypothetical protein
MKRNRNRLLVTLVLTVAIAIAGVGHARAFTLGQPSASANTPTLSKPVARTANGEPDAGQTVTPDVIPTVKSLTGLLGGVSSSSYWSSLNQWIWATWLTRFAR